MSEPEEDEDDMPDYKDSTRSGVVEGNVIANVVADGDGDCRKCEDEEKDFFDAGDGAVISNRLSYAQSPRAAAALKTTPQSRKRQHRRFNHPTE